MNFQEQKAAGRPPAGGDRGWGYSQKQRMIFLACLFLLGLLGWVDYVTGYELGFFIMYSVPVGLVAWLLGRWPAILTALVASIAWWLADSCDGAKYSSAFYWVWNNVVHFLSFVINAVAIAKIKTELDEVHQVAAELATTRRALQTVAQLLTVCPTCGKPRPPAPATERIVLPKGSAVPPEIAAALCPDCVAPNPADKPV